MKSMILSMVAAATICCSPLHAQNNPTDGSKQASQEELTCKRIQRMEQKLSLDKQKAAQFAPLYKEYLEELDACYSATGDIKTESLSEEERGQQIEKRFQLRQWILDTQMEYYPKFKEILTAQQLECIFSHGERFNRNSKNCMHKAMAQKCEKKGNCKK